MRQEFIEVDHVCKDYAVYESNSSVTSRLFKRKKRIIKALNDISFSVSNGETIGYIGPNGSGKSTTVKLITGIVSPDSGRVRVFGMEPKKNRKELARNIGVVFGQKSQLWWELPVEDSFILYKTMYKVNDKDYNDCVEMIDSTLNIGSLIKKPVRQLSLGERVKCDIACSLIHNPDILFLDEPTIGVDTLTKEKLRIFMKKINSDLGKTIFLTSHDMQDIKSVCKRLIIVDNGKKKYDGILEDFIRENHIFKRIVIENKISNKVKEELLRTNAVKIVSYDEEHNHTSIEYDERMVNSSDMYSILAAGCSFDEFVVSDQSLESILNEYYMRNHKTV